MIIRGLRGMGEWVNTGGDDAGNAFYYDAATGQTKIVDSSGNETILEAQKSFYQKTYEYLLGIGDPAWAESIGYPNDPAWMASKVAELEQLYLANPSAYPSPFPVNGTYEQKLDYTARLMASGITGQMEQHQASERSEFDLGDYLLPILSIGAGFAIPGFGLTSFASEAFNVASSGGVESLIAGGGSIYDAIPVSDAGGVISASDAVAAVEGAAGQAALTAYDSAIAAGHSIEVAAAASDVASQLVDAGMSMSDALASAADTAASITAEGAASATGEAIGAGGGTFPASTDQEIIQASDTGQAPPRGTVQIIDDAGNVLTEITPQEYLALTDTAGAGAVVSSSGSGASWLTSGTVTAGAGLATTLLRSSQTPTRSPALAPWGQPSSGYITPAGDDDGGLLGSEKSSIIPWGLIIAGAIALTGN